MRKLNRDVAVFALLLLVCSIAGHAQTFAGTSGGDVFILPPFRFCLGADNGHNVCFVQNGDQISRASGALDAPLQTATVATLPSAAANASRLRIVTDGTSSSDCTAGGGSTRALCMSNGTTWVGIGGGAAATAIQSSTPLPAVPCTLGAVFNLTSTSTTTDTLYRCTLFNGGSGTWQQIKPTVETVYAKDYGVQATAQIIADATTTNGSSTITCPNNDCNFTTTNPARTCGQNACVGDIVFAAGPLSASQNSTLVCPQSTILTINGAQSITVAAANDCTATQTANAQLVWGPDDTTNLANAYTAAVAACNVLQLPAGTMLVQGALFNTPNTICGVAQPYRIPGVFGASSVGTTLVPTPNFSFTNCSGGGRTACFFGVSFQLVFYLEVNGIGLTPAGCPTTTSLVTNNGGLFYDDLFEGWCGNGSSGAANNVGGMNFLANESEGLFGGTIGFGNPACMINGTQNQLFNWPCNATSIPGLVIAGTQFISQGNDYSGIQVNSTGSMSSFSDRDITGATTGWVVKGTAYINNYVFAANHTVPPISISGLNSKVVATNTNFVAANSGASNGQWLNAENTSSFIDNGGNTFSGTALSSNPSIVQSQGTTTAAGTTPYGFAFTNNTCGNTACPGNMLQLFLRWTPSTNTLTSCTDTLGNTWTQNGSTLTTTSTSGAAVNTAMLTVGANKPAGGADTISCSFSANNTFTTGMRVEWKQANSSYDLAIQTNSGNGTAISGTQTTVTNNAVTGFVIADNVATSIVSGTCSPVNPCTAWPFNVSASGAHGLFQIVPTAGSTTSAGTIGATSDWAGFWFTIRPLLSQPPVLNYPQSGTCTFSGTTCTVSFTQAFPVTPRCSAGDETAAAPIRTQPSLTQVILTGGTGAGATDVVDWNCK